jgi:hypothetical protein
MKKKNLFIIAVLFIGTAIITSAFAIITSAFVNRKPVKANDEKGFAVIELFTSEGCSDCPSADEVIAKLQNEDHDQPVYILAYHVDYWDNSSWKDAFSSRAYSNRQRQYSDWFHLNSVYTPQVVVNGKKEFVGSQEGTLRNVLKSDLDMGAKAKLEFNHVVLEANKVSFTYHSSSVGNNVDLVTALIQPHGQSKVRGGENSGRFLSHVQIVRTFQQQSLNSQNDGNVSISIPQSGNLKDWQVIGFLQDTRSGEILGATKVGLGTSENQQ